MEKELTKKLKKITRLIESTVDDDIIYGASFSLIGDNINEQHYIGYQGVNQEKIGLKPGMLYDIASLTKVVGTTTRILQLIAERKIHLEDEIGTYISDFSHPEITIYQLLTHTSGLPADFDNVHSLTKEQLITKIINVEFLPEKDNVYSDFNYILLGWLIDKLDGNLAESLEKNIFLPLGMQNTGYNPRINSYEDVVPTEVQPDRGGLIRGEVHDYKAYLLEGISGHAGLFSTLQDLTTFANNIVSTSGESENIISRDMINEIKQTNIGGRTIGWQRWGDKYEYYWHTGFTGTSIALNMENRTAFVCLTNRVYPSRKNNGWTSKRKEALEYFFGEENENDTK